jgi:hypothetical protein
MCPISEVNGNRLCAVCMISNPQILGGSGRSYIMSDIRLNFLLISNTYLTFESSKRCLGPDRYVHDNVPCPWPGCARDARKWKWTGTRTMDMDMGMDVDMDIDMAMARDININTNIFARNVFYWILYQSSCSDISLVRLEKTLILIYRLVCHRIRNHEIFLRYRIKGTVRRDLRGVKSGISC